MSMLALPEADLQEILMLFRHYLPHVPDAWLQELAANYGQDAVVDIDPNDVIAILSVPGKLHRIQVSLLQQESLLDVHRKMGHELVVRGIEPARIVASLLTIHDSTSTLADISEFWGLGARDSAGDERKGWAWYIQKPTAAFREFKQILCIT